MSTVKATISGAGAKDFGSNSSLDNWGSVTVTGGDIALNGQTILNEVKAVFDIQADVNFTDTRKMGAPGLITNYGDFKKTGGTRTSTIAAQATNYGQFVLQIGTLSFKGPISQVDGSTTFQGGNLTAPTFDLDGGDFTGTNTFTGNLNNTGATKTSTVYAGANGVGGLTILGNYTVSKKQSATTRVDVSAKGTVNVLTVAANGGVGGTTTINGGTVNIQRDPKFAPAPPKTLTFIQSATLVGKFANQGTLIPANEKWTTAPSIYRWQAQAAAPNYVLQVIGILPGKIKIGAFNDIKRTGIQDGTSTPLANDVVTLTGSDSTTQTALTAADGTYEFDNVNVGTTYTVSMTPPSGMSATAYEQGTDPSEWSAIHPDTYTSDPFTLTDDQPQVTIDGGFVTNPPTGTSSLGGLVTTSGTSPVGVAGVPVTLFDSTGAYDGSATTDSSGAYSFANIVAGGYNLQFVAPTGMMFASTPGTQTVPAGQTVAAATALLATDPGPTAVADTASTAGTAVSVPVLANDTDPLGTPLAVTAVSAPANGTAVLVHDGIAGDDSVLYTPNAGYVGTDTFTYTVTDTQGVSATGTVTVQVTAPQTPVTIGSKVWLDQNGNGLLDAGESGAAGVYVDLLDGSGHVVDVTQTDASGNYQFTEQPGTYTVQVILSQGYGFTTKGQGTDPSVNSSIDPNTGLSVPVTLAAGQSNTNVNAGLVVVPPPSTGTVSGWAFEDDNTNHLWDANEQAIANVLVNLTGPGGTLSTQTDANGYYSFTGLTPGSYGVSTSGSSRSLEGYYLDDGTPIPSASVDVAAGQAANLDAAFLAPSTTTTLGESTSTSTVGQAVTFSVAVAPAGAAGSPSGTVTLYDGSTPLTTLTLSATGQCSYTTSSLAVGTHQLTAVYAGDATFQGSTSNAVTETVGQGVGPYASVMLTESAQSGPVGQSVTFTATVSAGGPTAPTGTVSFWADGTLLATIGLTPGMSGEQAVYSSSSLGVGSHQITATYNGDANYAPCSMWLTYTVFSM